MDEHTPDDATMKSGRRHSGADQAAINSIVEAAIFLGADHPRISAADIPAPGEWAPDEKSVVGFGGEIKALGNGRIGGYLVRYGAPNQTDLVGDFFTPETEFGPHTETPVFYNHGLDPVLGKSVIGTGKLKRDSVGVWVEAQLAARGEYEKHVAAIYELAEAGKLGWSSGTAGHLMDREPVGKANRIKMWFLGLDASVTPTPAEPRNGAVTLKAFSESAPMAEWPAPKGAPDDEPPATKSNPINHKEQTNMGDEQTTTPAAMPAEYAAKLDSLLASVGALATTVEAMKKAPVESAPGIAGILESGKAPAVKTIHETMADEQLTALKAYAAREIGKDAWKAHNAKLATVQVDVERAWSALVHDPVNPYKRHEYEQALKATMVTTAGSLGANLIPNRYSNQLVGTLMESSILRMAGATIMAVEGTQSFNVPTVTRSGSAPLTTENAANTQSEPTFGNVEFKPYAYRAEYRATREQLGDTRIPMEAMLMTNAGWQLTQSENNHFGAGTGASQPQGINQATTAVSAGSALSLLTYDHLIDLQHSVPYQYRPQSAWFMSDGVAKQIRKLTDKSGGAASTGRSLWEPSMTVGQPDRLFGNPVFTLNSMASSGSASNVIVYGAPAFFWIADFNNAGVDFQILNELYAASAAVGWWFWKRVDSHIVVSEAFRGLRLV